MSHEQTHCAHCVEVHLQSQKYEKDFRQWVWRLVLVVPATLALMFLSYPPWMGWFLCAPVYFISGFPFLKGMVFSLWRRHPDMNALIGLGATAAFFSKYFDTTAMLMTFLMIGHLLEAKTKRAASRSLQSLFEEMPRAVHRFAGENLEDVEAKELKEGDFILVRPGEEILIDGTIVEGMSAVNESLLTGESLPTLRRFGDKVYAGTHNIDGSIKVRVEKVEEKTFLAQIRKRTEEALTAKAPIEKLADKISAVFVPIVLVTAVVAFWFWYQIDPRHDFSLAIRFAIAVVIIACPCALGLATPTAVMAGVGRGATTGILIKGGEVLEKAENLHTIVLDKTGTITEGRPKVKEVLLPKEPLMESVEVIRLAAMVENYSEHLLARAMVEEAKKRKLELKPLTNFKAYPGLGAKAVWEGKEILVGSAGFLADSGIPYANLAEAAQEKRERGFTVIFVVLDRHLLGAIVLEDIIKARAQEAVQKLKGMGLAVWMITGDQKATAEEVAEDLGISKVMSSMKPSEKVAAIAELKKEGLGVAMVGDGINDAMALAAADVGIAYASGSDLAKAASDITLLRNDPMAIVDAIELAKKTYRTIRQNLWFSFGYNLLAIPIAAGVFYPTLGLKLSPEIAAIAMSLSSVSVVLNSLRLRRG